jgi:hypothetical protein
MNLGRVELDFHEITYHQQMEASDQFDVPAA